LIAVEPGEALLGRQAGEPLLGRQAARRCSGAYWAMTSAGGSASSSLVISSS